MSQFVYDYVILTEQKYVSPIEKDDYINNLLLEDQLIMDALSNKGFRVFRTNWDNKSFDWKQAKTLIIRSTWDYSERINEFLDWLNKIEEVCEIINSAETIRWNIDKHYLNDLKENGIKIVPTYFVEKGDSILLKEICQHQSWTDIVIKPVISCAGRETYKVLNNKIKENESLFKRLVNHEAMMVQPFIKSIQTKGEISMMVFGGKYSHCVLKKAKSGDFRVQDDFGGTVHDYAANDSEITFAENVVNACKELPFYARIDVVWDDNDLLCLSELELIEPELWFRNREEAADELAVYIKK